MIKVNHNLFSELLINCLLDDIYGSIIMKAARLEDIGKEGELANKKVVDNGQYFPTRAHTMVGRLRLINLKQAILDIKDKNIEGDFMECGVWRGGVTIFMNAMNKYYGMNKRVYVLDSFEGLPEPDLKYLADQSSSLHTWDELRVSLEQVKQNFRKYNVLDENVIFVKGFFSETVSTVDVEAISILRLDGDMYSSTIDCLNAFFSKVVIGGYVIIDDYGCKPVGCKQAVDDFRLINHINTPLINIDDTGYYWIKE